MATQTLASADAILKDVYEGPVIEQLNYKTYMIDQIERETQFQMTARGRQAVLAAHTGRNRGRGARGDAGDLPNAGVQKWTDIFVPINYFYQGIELSDASIEATKSNDGAFVSLLDAEVKGATQDMKKDVNRQIWGPGNGKLATCVSTAGSVITVDSIQYLKVGDPVDVVLLADGTASTAGGTGLVVTALNAATPSVTVSGTLGGTPGATYGVYLAGSYGNEMKSLQEIVEVDRDIFGVDSSTAGNEWWNAQVIEVGADAANPAVAGETSFELIADKVGETGQGETESYVTTRGIRRRLADTFQSTKRFTNREAVQIHGGYSAIMVASGSGERPVIIDDDCPKGNVFALDKSALRWYQQTTPGFLADPKSGQILHLKNSASSGVDKQAVWQGWMRWYASLATTAPNRLGRLKFCTDDAPGVTA